VVRAARPTACVTQRPRSTNWSQVNAGSRSRGRTGFHRVGWRRRRRTEPVARCWPSCVSAATRSCATRSGARRCCWTVSRTGRSSWSKTSRTPTTSSSRSSTLHTRRSVEGFDISVVARARDGASCVGLVRRRPGDDRRSCLALHQRSVAQEEFASWANERHQGSAWPCQDSSAPGQSSSAESGLSPSTDALAAASTCHSARATNSPTVMTSGSCRLRRNNSKLRTLSLIGPPLAPVNWSREPTITKDRG